MKDLCDEGYAKFIYSAKELSDYLLEYKRSKNTRNKTNFFKPNATKNITNEINRYLI